MATLTGVVTPPVLLGLMFVFGIGFGFTGPASKAVIDDLVPAAQLAAAIALDGVVVNVGRAAGPALAGVLIAAAGPGAVFAITAVSFVDALVAPARWRRPTPPPPGPREKRQRSRRRRREVRALHTRMVGDPDHATDVKITFGARDDATLVTIVGCGWQRSVRRDRRCASATSAAGAPCCPLPRSRRRIACGPGDCRPWSSASPPGAKLRPSHAPTVRCPQPRTARRSQPPTDP